MITNDLELNREYLTEKRVKYNYSVSIQPGYEAIQKRDRQKGNVTINAGFNLIRITDEEIYQRGPDLFKSLFCNYTYENRLIKLQENKVS